MAPTQQASSKQELSTKDAMFLLELMRDSPQPILFYISPYCQKTGAKPNTVAKRLSEIKKRNGLNIVTTTNPPTGNNGYAVPKAACAGKRGRGDDESEGKPNVKRGRALKAAGEPFAQEPPSVNRVKVEASDFQGLGVTYSLPSPADSTAGTTPLGTTAMGEITGWSMTQIPLYMSQKKRTLNDFQEREHDINKKIKTES
ncbi:uncharacterized protein Z519_06760 [Cladophialophora bantiana CBS 173.52]|uniref:Uncharacterized protein n=1 Tax=Cladophialophora bantiana (strain ATCC 10958 / CBS 173.52 / CDC B-1940 / NIH 8579) TaxID=1442370 RepID=A0A0D2ESR4_CLAB1|nr:uncharacterized protein Z519_06760 [Cladophialophora bantiana CBS 173.52]KIW92911.1 hypothetical protein Z519_06760 [Cladophialophora bantiana CBS 173.52]